jgi:hypothetical protein
MRVSVLENFRTGGGSVSVFAKIENLTVAKFPQQDSAVRAFNKLARTFAAQVETLKRYRGGGEQTMPRGVGLAVVNGPR